MTRHGPKLAVALIVAVLLAIAGYVAAGPYLTVRAIKDALREQDSAAHAEQVDFPMLREAAHELRALLDEDGLASFPKTTGNRGNHVHVPIGPGSPAMIRSSSGGMRSRSRPSRKIHARSGNCDPLV